MNIIGKIIGLLALVFMIMILVNFRSVLPYISQVMFGGNATTSVTAITDDLLKQVKAIYPADSLASYAAGDRNTVQVYTVIRSLTTNRSYSNNTNQANAGLVTFSLSGPRLSMVTENVTIPVEMQGKYHFWLTNTKDISSSTTYIDFGTVRYSGRQMYIHNLGTSSEEFSFATYKYLKIIYPTDFTIFAESVLQ